MTTTNGSITKSGDRSITITRVFDAPPALVFRAYTDAQIIPKWWGPRRYTTIVDRLEARAGGSWRFINRDADGTEYGFHGVFHLVEEGHQLVQTFEWEGLPGHVSLQTATFEDQGDKTLLQSVAVFQSPEDCDGMLDSDMETGVNEGNERLDEVLHRLTDGRREGGG